MDRETLIQTLIVETMHRIVDQQRASQLLDILENGFEGFRNMTDKALTMELSRCGLDMDDDASPVMEFDDDHDELDDHDEYDTALMAGYSGVELDYHPLHDK